MKLDLRALDREFAHLLQQHWQATSEVAEAGAQVSAALGQGDTRVAWSAVPDLKGVPAVAEVASDTDLGVRTEPARRPLVLDGDFIALHRPWTQEHRLARTFRSLSLPTAETLLPGTLGLLDQLFPPRLAETLQRQAALLPFQSRLAVISGGPGTGKTRVLARLLALVYEQALGAGLAPPRVALCAPTGKAARRMAEALAKAVADDPETLAPYAELKALLPVTIHRLLGLGGPLNVDLVAVDEASMVDLGLMDALLSALPPRAKLVLLGDADQLPPVEPGRVLGDLVAGLVSLQPTPVVVLTHSYRFDGQQAIGLVAQAVNSGNASATLEALRRPVTSDSSCTLEPLFVPQQVVEMLRRKFAPFLATRTPQTAWDALDSYLALAVVNDGPWGQVGLNQALVEVLHPAEPRPVMITENDPRTGLSNGELGVILPGPGGNLAWFRGFERPFPEPLLPPHQTAFVITIHKSQGSEFDSLTVVLPPDRERSRLTLSRELLYTAITRAKRHCVLVATEDQLRQAVATPNQRQSGLLDKLARWKNPTP
ncbi:MAG: exodeoxyribonuclease V subunit alpha [Spirochaetales bacterium]